MEYQPAQAENFSNSSRVLNLFELTRKRLNAPPPPPMFDDDGDDTVVATAQAVDPNNMAGNFFLNETLNNAVIIKHRISPEERRMMANPEALVGTKIFIRYGEKDSRDNSGKYMFLGQKGAEDVFQQHFGLSPEKNPDDRRDILLLHSLDRLPSLDPFLLRDRLTRMGLGIDEAYFRLSESEARKYRESVIREFYPLAKTAFRGAADIDRLSGLIVDKMWEATDLQVLKPMMDAMDIPFAESNDIFFAWKGFVYYKLILQKISENFAMFVTSLQAAQAVNMPTPAVKEEIENLRPRVVSALREEFQKATNSIDQYDLAYRHEMIRKGQPKQFTAFLRDASRHFDHLGASVAGIDHAQTTWRRRFGKQKDPFIPGPLFLELLKDFADGLPV